MKEIKAVIFDMDGTITDTESIYVPCWQQAFNDYGYSDFNREDALSLRSLNHVDLVLRMKERYGEDFDYEPVHQHCAAIFETKIKDSIPLKPYVKEALDFCREHNLRSAVATATTYERASERLKRIGLFDSFDTVISAHQVKKGKPYPDVYLYACETLGLSPDECIAVEDAPNGVRAASSAGCNTIMIPDLTPADDEMNSLIVTSVENLKEFCEYLESSVL